MPGFGEQMARAEPEVRAAAILSRQVAVIRSRPRHQSAGQPESIRETLQGLPDAPGILCRGAYCID